MECLADREPRLRLERGFRHSIKKPPQHLLGDFFLSVYL